MNTTAPIPLSHLSFPAYIGESEKKQRHRVGFLSLAHYFESEKFRGKDPSLYAAAINSPTIKELRKLVKHNQAQWRDDWTGVRGRVLVCGMQYAAWSDPDPERWTSAPEALIIELTEMGFPAKFSAAAVQEFTRLQDNPKVIYFGIDTAPPDVIGKRVNNIHRKHLRAWTLVHWLGRHSSWRIHDWALNQFIPIQYFGSHGESLSCSEIDALLQMASLSCVFEQRGGKALDAVIRQIRARKHPLEMDFYNV